MQSDMQDDDVDPERWVLDEEGESLKTSCSVTGGWEVTLEWRIDWFSARSATCSLVCTPDAQLESGSISISLDDM